MKKTTYVTCTLVSALPFILLACSTNSNLPELPQVPIDAEFPEIATLPQLPDPARAPDLPQAAELPQINEVPQSTDLAQATDLLQSPELPQETALPQLPELADQTDFQQPELSQSGAVPEVEILGVDIQPASQAELPPVPDASQDIASLTPAENALPAEETLEDNGTRPNTLISTDGPPDSSMSLPLQLVADDLAKGLSFIPSMDPSLVSIRISTPGSEFDNKVKSSMESVGYNFAFGHKSDERQHLTTAFVATKEDQQLRSLLAIMAINGTLIKRTYQIQDNTIEPLTSYIFHGISPVRVVSNDLVEVL